jgi:FkbM family methyltransferase
MTGAPDPPASLPPVRAAAVKAIARLPGPVRRGIWRARRAAGRRRRRRLEARGDWSLSYPALHDLDRQLERILDRDGGFFVEAGGNDGYVQSNTYALERRRGWRGILVEPEPELARACAVERPGSTVVRAALVAAGFPEPEVTLRFGGLMTLIARARLADDEWVAEAHTAGQEAPDHEFTAPARTLSSILDEAGAPEVDLLSLDVEGYEAQALAGLDLDRHAPRRILVEMRDPKRDRAPIEAVLGERYRSAAALSPFDLLYERADLSC